MQLTYQNLRKLLDAEQSSPGASVELETGVSIHTHPQSGRPLEIHFMVDGQKVAEIGPPDAVEGVTSDVAPAYIDLLAEWDGKPVRHDAWKRRLLMDNGLDAQADNAERTLALGVLQALEDDMHGAVLLQAEELARAVLTSHAVHPSYDAAIVAPRVRFGG